MNKKIYCEICKTDHPAEEFQQVSSGSVTRGNAALNWIMLRCLITGMDFSISFEEPVTDTAKES